MQLSGLSVYPIKSGAPLDVAEAVVEPRGLRHDRRWMVVDPDGQCLTGRDLPRLTLVRAQPGHDGLALDAPGMQPLHVSPSHTASLMPVVVWKSRVDARAVGAAADDWLSEFLGRPVRLVHMDASARRAITSSRAGPGDEVSFADSFPVLLISRAALDGLNDRLARPVSMLRFRPNFVVDGVPAHDEDGWKRIRVGGVEFDVAKPCTRCVFTTVDPERGERDADGEPLRTLVGYRRTDEGVTFGQLLVPRASGVVRRGDAFEILG